MTIETFVAPENMSLVVFYDLVEGLASGAGITVDSNNFRKVGGSFQFEVTPALTTGQRNAIQNALDNWIYVDYATLSEATKPNAKTVLSDMEALYDFAAPYYTGLSGSQKAAILANLTTDWNTATAAQKADALRALLSLIVVAIYFIYLKFIDNGN